jgi:hypothetical protein
MLLALLFHFQGRITMSGGCNTENNRTVIPSDDVFVEAIASKFGIASQAVTDAIEKHTEALKKAGIEEVVVTTSKQESDDPIQFTMKNVPALRIEYKDTNGSYDVGSANETMGKIVETLKEAGVQSQLTSIKPCAGSPVAIVAPLTPNTIVPFSDRTR